MDSDDRKNNVQFVFKNLSAEDPEILDVESLCLNCGDNGSTKIHCTKIPFFKEIVIMSFDCTHCGYQNNEVQSAGAIEEKGIRIKLTVSTEKDLNRQIIKSNYTSIQIPEIDFEIPSQSQKGEVTTVEGVVRRAITGLSQDQKSRKREHPELANEVNNFIKQLEDLADLKHTFTMILEDISGNTFVSNPSMPQKDIRCEVINFVRSREQDHILGIFKSEGNTFASLEPSQLTYEDLLGEVHQFATNCSNCNAPCQTNMKVTNIPHFKEVVIMATSCEECGHRTNEVKGGGPIEPLGQRITVKIDSKHDFDRDVLKSDTCSLEIPELDLEVGPGALGGRFTTIEGLIRSTKDQLQESGTMFTDACESDTEKSLNSFLNQMETVLSGNVPITIVLDDPAGNSYVQNIMHPDPDPKLIIKHYERTFEQNEVLGLNDIKTEDYEALH